MSNSYFQFKQFRIEQEDCAMKVSTDACIQGAWTPITDNVYNVLDIGTGTGLLSLMLAQKNAEIHIDAIELDASAAVQAKYNVAISPWKDRIEVIQTDARDFVVAKKYELIICNPPFFSNSLLGDDDARNSARHGINLNYSDMALAIKNNLADGGYASVLLPYSEYEAWGKITKAEGLHVFKRVFIKPTAASAYNRVVSLCAFTKVMEPVSEELVIYERPNEYTVQCRELLAPYYLKL